MVVLPETCAGDHFGARTPYKRVDGLLVHFKIAFQPVAFDVNHLSVHDTLGSNSCNNNQLSFNQSSNPNLTLTLTLNPNTKP